MSEDNIIPISETPGANIAVPEGTGIATPDEFLDPEDVQAYIQSNGGSTVLSGPTAAYLNGVLVKRLSSDATIPTLGTPGAAGFDLYASEEALISSGARTLIKTDIALVIPQGWCGQINPRSSYAHKHNLRIGARIIDSDYRGEILVNIHNDSNQDYTIHAGDRIAQILFMPVLTMPIYEIDELPVTERGEGGFGSTGQ